MRTGRFPSEVDTQATFVEISERLRDPEWEVRQHALRVLMDVLPTINADAVDKLMQPVVPELINNLGHTAPAVRKGALDTLRVYLVHSPNKDGMVKNVNVAPLFLHFDDRVISLDEIFDARHASPHPNLTLSRFSTTA